MRPRPAQYRFIALLAGLAAAFLFLGMSGCQSPGYEVGYRFSDSSAYSVRYEAGLEAKAEGFRGSRPYSAGAEARIAFTAVSDSASGRSELVLTADSLSFRASDRDASEGRYMEERLKRYRAKLVLSRNGQILTLEEEPDLPPVDFSPLNFGRFLAYGLPAYPAIAVREGSEWKVEQPLLDKFHPASRIVKKFRVKAIRETPAGRLLECKVEVEAWLEEGLGSQGFGATADPSQPSLSGRGETVFNLDRGTPVSSDLVMEGRFISQVREGGTDSARIVDLPLRLVLRLSLNFADDPALSPR